MHLSIGAIAGQYKHHKWQAKDAKTKPIDHTMGFLFSKILIANEHFSNHILAQGRTKNE
ncbi:MAG: hypothetical protein R3264_04475 [Anaerolineae bacterium]|nr:hypothetical protein [Anaerolineae bacterium]